MRTIPAFVTLATWGLLAPPAAAAGPHPIALLPVVTFQQGVNGYAGAVDTELRENNPGTPQNTAASVSVDLDDGGGKTNGLIRFDSIFGPGSGRIPVGSIINSASLTMVVVDPASGGDRITLHRMLVSWPDTATWTSMGSGIQADDTESATAADTVLADAGSTGSHAFVGLAATLQAWSDGTPNYGWAILTNSADGWDFAASDTTASGSRPLLGVDYTPPPLRIIKRAFQLDGTPINHGNPAPKGALVRFLLYVNNARPAVTDVSLEDILNPGLEYQPGTMTFDSSVAACADTVCTGAEEAAIYAAAVAGVAGTDAVDGDEVSVAGTTLSIGNRTAANTQLDIPADRVWAVVFTARIR